MKYTSKTLSNGVEIPSIAFGTDIALQWRCESNIIMQQLKKAKSYAKLIKNHNIKKIKFDINLEKIIKELPEHGCNLIDTSRAYGGSEKAIARALKGKNRDNYFVTTKISNYDQRTIGAKKSLECSLKQLEMDYVDLYLIHWPQTDTWIKCWKEFEELYKEGKCKAIGVCNCNIHHLELLKQHSNIIPMVNQFECHPLFTQNELRKYCKENSITVMSYTSTARMDFRLKNSKRMQSLCEKYSKDLNQLILRWHIQSGNIPIFNTSSINHMISNLDIWDFNIDDDDISIISGMNINARTRYDPDNCEFDRL